MLSRSSHVLTTLAFLTSRFARAAGYFAACPQKWICLALALTLVTLDGGPAWPQEAPKQDEVAIDRQREANLKEMNSRLEKLAVRARQKERDVRAEGIRETLVALQ